MALKKEWNDIVAGVIFVQGQFHSKKRYNQQCFPQSCHHLYTEISEKKSWTTSFCLMPSFPKKRVRLKSKKPEIDGKTLAIVARGSRKSTINGGSNGNVIYKYCSFNCHVWSPEAIIIVCSTSYTTFKYTSIKKKHVRRELLCITKLPSSHILLPLGPLLNLSLWWLRSIISYNVGTRR